MRKLTPSTKQYNRNTYSSRGKLPQRDYLGEGVLWTRSCTQCGKALTRKVGRSGRPEDWRAFTRRKTCGNYWNGERYMPTECKHQLTVGTNNGNYKGYMPTCSVCGVRIMSYRSAEEMAAGRLPKFCWEHAQRSYKEGELHDAAAERNRKRGSQMCGKYPEHLKAFAFKKGAAPHNKKHELCAIEACGNKHLARGLCSKHYQRDRLAS